MRFEDGAHLIIFCLQNRIGHVVVTFCATHRQSQERLRGMLDGIFEPLLAAEHLVIATGYLVRNYKMLSREQWLEDTIKHTSQAFLGLTMGCAKCHDHMTDPILQTEYYQMRAIFEPHQVRTDRMPGKLDLLKDGLVRAYDTATNAPTFFFVRGDERKPDTNRVMEPGVPKVLRGDLAVRPVQLPASVAHPD